MKKYGIRITLPADSTMVMEHLLGKQFEAFRWYEGKTQRNAAYEEMQHQSAYYRSGDLIQQILKKVRQ